MGWGTGSIDTTHLDAGTDSPSQARPALKNMADQVTAIIAGRGTADGVCDLDGSALVPASRLGNALVAANNLSDLVSAATARTNLGGTTIGANVYTAADAAAVRALISALNKSGDTMIGDLLVQTGASRSITVESTTNGTTARTRLKGKTSGAVVIDGEVIADGSVGDFIIRTTSDHGIRFYTNSAHRFQITKDGEFKTAAGDFVRHDGNTPRNSSLGHTWTPGTIIGLVHGLGATPKEFWVLLRCVIAEVGYAVGDVVRPENGNDDGTPRGVAVFANATNINILPNSSGLRLINGTTGGGTTAITPANWVFDAYWNK